MHKVSVYMFSETKISNDISMESLIDVRPIPVDAREIRLADLPPDFKGFNPSGVFDVDGVPVIAVRVEPRNDELASRTLFYRYEHPSNEQPSKPLERFSDISFPWQDPCVARVQGKLIIGGVRIVRDQLNPSIVDNFFTEFYIGSSLQDLEYLGRGPDRHKDIRLVDMGDDNINKVGVFGRPQFGHATGDISFNTIDNPYELSPSVIDNAQIITQGKFEKGMWCGVNDAVHLGNGQIAVLGHLARFNPNNPILKQYCGLKFIYDTNTDTIYDEAIFALRKDLTTTEIINMSQENEDVVFAGGFHHEDIDRATKLARLGDKALEAFRVSFGLSDDSFGICEIVYARAS